MSGHDGARVVAAFVGKTGSGKSTKLREYADRARRLLVADAKKDWRPRREDVVVEGHEALLAAIEELGAFDPAVPFGLIYRAPRTEMQVVPFRTAMRLTHCTLVLDEARLFSTPSFIPPALDELVVTGRHASVNLLYAATRPQAVHPSMHAEADVAFLFRLEEPLALARVRENWPGLERVLPTLPMPKKGGGGPRLKDHFRTYGNPDDLKLIGK